MHDAGKALLVLMTLAFTCAARVADARTTRYAIVIGNNLGLASSDPLQYAERDAERMAGLLVELGRVAPENLLLLRGKGPGELRAAFEDISRRAAARPGEALFLFYYSGHADSGWLRMGGQGMALEEVRRRLEELPVKVRVAIVDACQSGAITRARGGKVVSPFMEDMPVRVEGLVILTSASAEEVAQESDILGSSFFSHHLMSGLRGPADTSGDGTVTALEAYDYAYRLTVRETEGTEAGAQHPTFLYAIEGEGDVPLTSIGMGRARIDLAPSIAGTVLFIGAAGRIEAEVVKYEGRPISVALVPGSYEVRWRAADGLYSHSLTLEDEDVRALDPAAFRWRPLYRGTARGADLAGDIRLLPVDPTDIPLGGGAWWGMSSAPAAPPPASVPDALEDDPWEEDPAFAGPGYDDSGSFSRIEGAGLWPPLALGVSLVAPGVPQIIEGEAGRGGVLLGVFTVATAGALALGLNHDRFPGHVGRGAGIAGAAALGYTAFYTYTFAAIDAFYSVSRGGPGPFDIEESRFDIGSSLATSLGHGPRGEPVLGLGGGLGAGFAAHPRLVLGLRDAMAVRRGDLSVAQIGPDLRWRSPVRRQIALSAAAGAIFQLHVERSGAGADLWREDPEQRIGWSVFPYLAGGLHLFPARSWSLDFGLRAGMTAGTRHRLLGPSQPDGSFAAEYVGGLTWYL